MKKIFTLILYSALFILNCTAQTNVSGFINTNTTWNLAGSPYIVVGNTLLAQGFTLTIDPGVVIKFNDSTSLQIDGELRAIGTPTQRIVFTSNQPVQAAGDWGKIQFSGNSTGASFDVSGNYISGCIMKYCDVLYGGGLGVGAVDIQSSSLYMSNCKISNSSHNGIYCMGQIKIDSSSVRNCARIGLKLTSVSPTYCPYTIQYDTIEYNGEGGILATIVMSGCSAPTVTISHNVFSHNSDPGALYLDGNVRYRITENEFISNSSLTTHGAAINCELGNMTVACNRFIGNTANNVSTVYVHDGFDTDTIINNLFDGNISLVNNSTAAVMFLLYYYDDSVSIHNNRFINNIAQGGATLSLIGQATATNVAQFFVSHNEFNSNLGNAEISIATGGSSNLQLNDISNNNFLSANMQYGILNITPYTGPDIKADSNYWNSTSTQYVDSAIYDFFDNANNSIVYYSPILTAPALVDTTCPPSIIPSVTNIDREIFSLGVYPNPFTTQATISFNKEVHNATFSLYNLLGEKVAEVSGINGESFQFNRGNLRNGVYVFEVREDGNEAYRGKAVAY